MKLMIFMVLAASLLAGTIHDQCSGISFVTTNPKHLIYGCTYQAEGRVDVGETCSRTCIYSRLRIIGKYDSGWTRGTRKASYKYTAFVTGTVDVVFEWVCIECGAYGREAKRFRIEG